MWLAKPAWTKIVGRIGDQIKTSNGPSIGRLDHITKPGAGIRESQIVQTALNRIVIKVVPNFNFDPNSMQAVLEAAYRYLGNSIQVSWVLVDKLERTKLGKLKYVIREIDND